ncbi:MAG: HlyD family efflux transporter periplasmic adaptor subunit [Cyanobacteria bacterium P01_F01_bin.53]
MPTESFSSQPPPKPADGPDSVASINTEESIEAPTSAENPPSWESSRAKRRSTFPRWRKPNKPLWPAVALAMFVVASFVGLKAYKSLTTVPPEDGAETTTDPARLPVRVVVAKTDLVQQWVFDEGAVWPVRRRVLNFQASGDITYVAKVNGVELREGDFVSRGELLASIDARRQLSGIETAESDMQVSQTQRNQSEASLRQAEASVQRAKSDLSLAETELSRYADLFEQGAISESDRDAYINRVDQAAAALMTAQQDVQVAQEGIRSAEASVDASRARLNETNIELEDTQLISPIDGVVAYINIREGEYWSTQYINTSSSQDLIETAPIVVVDPRSFEVELELQAEEASGIRPGQRAYVVLEEEISAAQAAGTTAQGLIDIAQRRGSGGEVFAVSPSQTPGSRGTEITIRGLEQVRNLKVGGRVYVWIEVSRRNDAVVLPLGALLSREQQSYAFVVNETDGTVSKRLVSPGIEGLSGVAIRSGIQPGEKVVVEGQNRLVDGTPVEIVNRESGL